MAGTQRLLAAFMAVSMANVSGSGTPEALGVVVRAEHATLGSAAAAAEGTTVYDGDRVSTDEAGSARLRIGAAMLDLGDKSSVILHSGAVRDPKQFEAELLTGTASLSAAAGTDAEIVASEARVLPISAARGIVRVRRVGPYELIVFAQRGPAQILYLGDSETIPEGKSYRVLLNSSDDERTSGSGAKHPGKWRKALLLIAIPAGAAVLAFGLWHETNKGVESPDRP